MPRPSAPAALRLRYTWYLRAPFDQLFCADHWWEKDEKKKLDPVVALYELARRHPRIGQLRTKFFKSYWHGHELDDTLTSAREKKLIATAFDDVGHEPAAVHCLCVIGLKTWPQLKPSYQEFWEDTAGKLKGVDCRDSTMQCTGLISDSFATLLIDRTMKLKGTKGVLKFRVEAGRGDSSGKAIRAERPADVASAQVQLGADLKKRPFRAKEIETLIAHNAVEAWRNGALLFSVVPDLTHERAAELLTSAYHKEQEHFGLAPQRARTNDWLLAIAAFETAEKAHGGAKAKTFTTYRRVMEGIEFDRRKPPLEHIIDRG